jgi:hypothetical protein
MTCGGCALGDEWLHMTPPPFWLVLAAVMVGYDRRPGACLRLDVPLSGLFLGLKHGGCQMLGLDN